MYITGRLTNGMIEELEALVIDLREDLIKFNKVAHLISRTESYGNLGTLAVNLRVLESVTAESLRRIGINDPLYDIPRPEVRP